MEAPGTTGDYNTDLSSKAKVATETLMNTDYDFGFVHVKAVDDAGHDKDPELKVYWLEKIDEMVGEIIERLAKGETQQNDGDDDENGENVRNGTRETEQCRYSICITGDHSTPALYGDHSCEPVPFTVGRVKNIVKVMADAERKRQAQKEDAIELLALEDDRVTAFDEISAAQVSLVSLQPPPPFVPSINTLLPFRAPCGDFLARRSCPS